MYTRELTTTNHSFFLFGPRGVGKSTWLREEYKDCFYIDLLLTRNFVSYTSNPDKLISEVKALSKDKWIVIDEIQRVPELLNIVHYLMENEGYKKFVLTGSSARKLKRNSANMLAGRAIMKKMFSLNSKETNFSVNADDRMQYGTLPLCLIQDNKQEKEDFLKTYVETYINEEIKAEGLTRNLGSFTRFLEVASLVAGSQINTSSIARDAEVNRETVRGYFSIFEDTLLGSWLTAYQHRIKTKQTVKPKFYWFDSGVLNAVASGFKRAMPSDWKGILFEHVIFQELSSYCYYNNTKGELGFWRLESGTEIDFLWWYGDEKVAIEVKSATKFKKEFLKGINAFTEPLKSSYIVYCGDEELQVENTKVLPYDKFCKLLHSGEIIV